MTFYAEIRRRLGTTSILSFLTLSLCISSINPCRLSAEAVYKTLRTPKIFDTDDRRQVSNTTSYPWSAVGMVEVRIGNQLLVGTGVMIGKKTVLTCGHGVYDQKLGWAESASFIPGKKGTVEPFGRIGVAEVIVPDGWTKQGDDNYDLALLILDTSIGDKTGYFDISVENDLFFNDHDVISAGYPQDLGSGSYMYWVTGKVYGLDENLFLHTIDSEPGQSGSPVWYGDTSSGNAQMIGIMKGTLEITQGTRVTEEGIGTVITQEFATWIKENMEKRKDTVQHISASTSTTGTGGCVGPTGGLILITMILANIGLCRP